MSNPHRDKGVRAELALVKMFQANGIDAIRLGEQTQRRGSSADRGDIHIGTVCIQSKDWTGKYPKGIPTGALMTLFDEVENQCRAAGLHVWVLTEKRAGHADPRRWWAWMTHQNYLRLTVPGGAGWLFEPKHPIRVELGDILSDIRDAFEKGFVA